MASEHDAQDAVAAIFDLDGTLVDTMPIHFQAYRAVFADLGMELPESDFYASIGGKASETIPRLLRGRSCGLSVAEIHVRKKDVVEQLLRRSTIPLLACSGLLPLLHGRVPLALASSGSRGGVDIVLERLGWWRFFEAVLTGEDVVRGKPAPDLFLLAAERLGVTASGCLVFEDTDAGVDAARQAGMQWFDVRAAAPSRSQL